VKVVLDTNVLVSGIFFAGPPSEILAACESGRVTLVLTPEVVEEYRRVTGELLAHYPDADAETVLDRLILGSEIYVSVVLRKPVCTDPDDDKFFACAIAGGARLIVSGDKHLRNASGSFGIRVLLPRAFVDIHLRS
jgi:putative PIN family toxin of toxin-antitoxin system